MSFRPFFIDGPAGPLFAIHHPPLAGTPDRGDIVYVPPFAEEMNQSRRMAAMQARRLAAAGLGVLLLDPYGTGDSAGDFGDARWEIWEGDVGAALDWLDANRRRPVGLWGLRLGALLAMAVARQQADRVRRVVLWQPVTKGKTMLNQFLRLRVATEMAQKGGRETTETLRRTLAEGRAVEVAGYVLDPELAAAIDLAELGPLSPPGGCRVDWLEVAPSAEAGPSPAARRIADAWREDGAQLALKTVIGEPFWSLQSLFEPVIAPALWDATDAALAQEHP